MVTEAIEMESVARSYFTDLSSTKGIGDISHLLLRVNMCVIDCMKNTLTIELQVKIKL